MDRIHQEAGKTLNDPWNLGYFIHNELSWTRSTTEDIDVGLTALMAASTQHAKIAFRDQLETKYGTIQALNSQWQTSFTSWNDFLVPRNVTPNLTGANTDLVAFDILYADQYFSTTQQAMRESAPNHLYLGARCTGGVRLSAAQAAVAYADVVSINRYGPDISVLPAGLEGDVPLISGEFHFSANDTGLWSDGLKTANDSLNITDVVGEALTLCDTDGGDVVDIMGGNFKFDVDPAGTGPDVVVGQTATINMAAGTRLNSLRNNGQINIVASPDPSGVLTVGDLTMGPSATIDLANNGLVITYRHLAPDHHSLVDHQRLQRRGLGRCRDHDKLRRCNPVGRGLRRNFIPFRTGRRSVHGPGGGFNLGADPPYALRRCKPK